MPITSRSPQKKIIRHNRRAHHAHSSRSFLPLVLLTATAAVIATGAFFAVSAQTFDPRIRLNTVGFLPGFPKQATVAANFTVFALFSANGTEAYRGYPSELMRNNDTREDTVRIADFSDFNVPGSYYLFVPNVGRSPTFTIGEEVFVEPFRAVMLGFYLWRCGTAVSASYNGRNYSHKACHTNDGDLQYYDPGADSNGKKDGAGGWHDAGDYNKYTVNSGAAVAFTLKAWEHFWHLLVNTPLVSVTNNGALPAYLAEVKWNLDWVSKMQFGDGRVSHKLSTLNFGGEVMPENESATRYYAPWNTMATASFVGQMAMAARIYAPYDKAFAAKCLEQARRSYKTLMDSEFVGETQAPFETGQYGGGNDSDKRLWAAAEMWETTGDPEFLAELERRLPAVGSQITWANVSTIAALTYLNSRRAGRDSATLDGARKRLVSTADGLIDFAKTHGYARNISLYNWGANGTVAGTAYVLHSAYLYTGDPKYRYAVQDAAAHLLGRNYYGRSFVTGVGHNPPKSPHDRTSTASRAPWPGRLIGGPHDQKGGAPASVTGCAAPATCWFDVSADYWTNEVAINWNAPTAYALAALMPGAGMRPAPAYPGQTTEDAAAISQTAEENSMSANRRAAPQKTGIRERGTTRIVSARNGKIDVPAGAKVYGLNGRLLAHKKSADAKLPLVNKNGVFLVKFAGNND